MRIIRITKTRNAHRSSVKARNVEESVINGDSPTPPITQRPEASSPNPSLAPTPYLCWMEESCSHLGPTTLYCPGYGYGVTRRCKTSSGHGMFMAEGLILPQPIWKGPTCSVRGTSRLLASTLITSYNPLKSYCNPGYPIILLTKTADPATLNPNP